MDGNGRGKWGAGRWFARLFQTRSAAAMSAGSSLAGSTPHRSKHDAHFERRVDRPHGLNGQAMRHHQVMADLVDAFQSSFTPGACSPLDIACLGNILGSLKVAQLPNTVPQTFDHQGRVIGKVSQVVALDPTAFILECLRKIPMMKRDKRLDIGCQQCIHQAVVKIQPCRD